MLDRYLEPDAIDEADPKYWMSEEEFEEFCSERRDCILFEE